MAELIITIKKFSPEAFSLIFQHGFMMRVRAGKSVREVLCSQLGLSNDYVEKRISTIFLDGKPVDDLDSSYVKNNSTLSLSAAMPGLVGAAMRRGGFYASLRNAITYRDGHSDTDDSDGIVRIKLFNMIINETGADLLRKGIYVSLDDINSLLSDERYDLIENCVGITIDGKELDCRSLPRLEPGIYDMVCLKLMVD